MNEQETIPRRSAWGLVGALGGSFCVYAFMGVAGVLGGESLTGFLVWAGIWVVAWLVSAIFQVRWWRAGKAKFWRPPYGALGLFWFCATLIGIPTLLIPRWRRWLFHNLEPEDDSVLDSLRRLDDIRATGVLTDEEYAAKKSEILARL